jgi:hypothetical protein
MPLAQRELINTEHPHPADRGIRQPADQPQQRRPAHRHAQTMRPTGIRPDPPAPTQLLPTPRAGRCCGGHGVRSNPVPAPRKYLRCSRRDRRSTGAPSGGAPPAARNGKVSHPPSIAAVHPGRNPRASWATRPPRPSMRCDDHRVVDTADAVDHHRRQMRQQNPATVSKCHRPRAPRQSPSEQPGPGFTECVPEPLTVTVDNRTGETRHKWLTEMIPISA